MPSVIPEKHQNVQCNVTSIVLLNNYCSSLKTNAQETMISSLLSEKDQSMKGTRHRFIQYVPPTLNIRKVLEADKTINEEKTRADQKGQLQAVTNSTVQTKT